jgi:tetratricopeptide (TPR) repeat protein
MCASCSDSIDPQQQAHDLFEQSKQYKKENDAEKQMAALMQAYQLLPQFNEPAFASQVCQALGNAYMYRDLYDESLHYNREAIAYALQEEPHGKQLSLAYSKLGRTFAELNQADSAQLYFEKALDQAILLQDTTEIAVGYGQLGVVCRLKKDYQKALDFERQQLAIYEQHKDSDYIPQAYYGIGAAYYYMSQLDSAKVYFENSLNTNNIYTKHGAYKALYLISKKQGKLEDAILYNDKFRDYADSVSLNNKTEAVAEIQAKYDNEKLLNQQAKLELNNLRLTLFLTFSILAIAIIVMAGSRVYRYMHRKIAESRIKLQESERIINLNQQEINRMTREIAEADINFNEKANLIMMQNGLLQKQNKNLMDYFSNNMPLLKTLKEHPKAIKDWKPIYELTDALQMNCYTRLKNGIPEMPDGSLNICCLIRLGFTTKQIAAIIGIEAESLTKRKGRIRDEIMSIHPDLFNNKMPLDSFVQSF